MSIRNFIDESIPFASSQDTEALTVNITGAFNSTITIELTKAGNMAMISIPPTNGLETGLGGVATGTFNFPVGFIPAPLPQVPDNPVLGIANLTINTTKNRNGNVSITISGNSATLSIGSFSVSGTTTNTIGLFQNVVIPYICS